MTWYNMANAPKVEDDTGMAEFQVTVSDEVAVTYTKTEFEEICSCIFGLAAQGEGEWTTTRFEDCMWTVYKGKGTPKLVGMFMAMAQGHGIHYMEVMGWK